MPSARSLVIAATLVAFTATAHADYADDLAVGLKIAQSQIKRTRRSIAIGPHIGYAGGADTLGNGLHGLTFGIGLYTFDIPSVFDLKDIIAARIRARVQEKVKQIIASGGVAPVDLSTIAAEVAADVKAELLGEDIHGKTREKPNWKLVLEGEKLFSAGGGGLVRLAVGKGFGPVQLALNGSIQRAQSTTTPIAGIEAGVPLTPTGVARTPVIDLFVRVDFAFADQKTSTFLLVGGRVLLDLL